MNSNTFINELYFRVRNPWKQTAFSLYFVFIILGYGAIGVTISFFDQMESEWNQVELLSESLATFFMAMLATNIIELNLSFNLKHIPSFLILSIGILGVCAALMMLSYKYTGWISLIPALLGFIISLVVWVVANSDNEKLNDEAFFKIMRGKEQGHGTNW